MSWSRTHDRLYALFALAFAILGTNGLLLAVLEDEHELFVFGLRALAFLLIIAAIADKNRPQTASQFVVRRHRGRP